PVCADQRNNPWPVAKKVRPTTTPESLILRPSWQVLFGNTGIVLSPPVADQTQVEPRPLQYAPPTICPIAFMSFGSPSVGNSWSPVADDQINPAQPTLGRQHAEPTTWP